MVGLACAVACSIANPAFAGTTGMLSGGVSDWRGKPVADAVVTVASPSLIARTRTDAKGAFHFLALGPETYVVSVEKDGIQPTSEVGIEVWADCVTSLTVTIRPPLSDYVWSRRTKRLDPNC